MPSSALIKLQGFKGDGDCASAVICVTGAELLLLRFIENIKF